MLKSQLPFVPCARSSVRPRRVWIAGPCVKPIGSRQKIHQWSRKLRWPPMVLKLDPNNCFLDSIDTRYFDLFWMHVMAQHAPKAHPVPMPPNRALLGLNQSTSFTCTKNAEQHGWPISSQATHWTATAKHKPLLRLLINARFLWWADVLFKVLLI